MPTRPPLPPIQLLLFEIRDWGWCGAGIHAEGVAFLHLPIADLSLALEDLQVRRHRGDAVYFPPITLFPEKPPVEKPAFSGGHITRELIRQVRDYFNGGRRAFDFPIWGLENATRFQQRVWMAARRIPYGETRTYGELAALSESPLAVRAVGQCMAKNPVSLAIPCHRVLAAGGVLGGFSAPQGPDLKKRLLEWEQKNMLSRGAL